MWFLILIIVCFALSLYFVSSGLERILFRKKGNTKKTAFEILFASLGFFLLFLLAEALV